MTQKAMFTHKSPSQTTEPWHTIGACYTIVDWPTEVTPSILPLDLVPPGSSRSRTLTSPQEPAEAPAWAPGHSQAMQTAHLASWIPEPSSTGKRERSEGICGLWTQLLARDQLAGLMRA